MWRITPLLLSVLCLSLVACQVPLSGNIPTPLHVTIGIQTSPAMALVMVAKDKGLFALEGLDVELKEFTAGKFALEAFLAGSLDYSISGEVPPILAALQGHAFVIPAQVVRKTINEVRVVALRDEYAGSANAYFSAKKRRLATSFGGGPEFFTYEYLKKLNIAAKDIEIISQKPGDMPATLISESVHAIAIFDPFAYIAEQQLGDKAVSFSDESMYSELYVIEAHEDIRTNPETTIKLIKALIAAEKFVKASPNESKEIVMKYTNLDRATIDGIWPNFDFRVALTPQLLEYWERQVVWAKETGKTATTTATPDFRSMLFTEPLQRIAPERIEL